MDSTGIKHLIVYEGSRHQHAATLSKLVWFSNVYESGFKQKLVQIDLRCIVG